ncbi:TPA: uracil-DNA glycosylase family protein [Photobacterium damselae]
MLSQFRQSVASLSFPLQQLPDSLRLAKASSLEIYYAPFDHINTAAKVVICGITPGLQQADIALQKAQQLLASNTPLAVVSQQAKETASFAGPMRRNLVRMLNHIGLQGRLGITDCEQLFTTRKDLVHYTSALRYPVFVNGKNYSGRTPKMLKEPLLRETIEQYLGEELRQLSADTLYISLGDAVADVLFFMAENGFIQRNQILAGMPHPSGANAERIAFFLGEKAQEDLSAKTNPAIILEKKQQLLALLK